MDQNSPDTQAQTPDLSPEQRAGIQQRIDQLTAKYHEERAKNEQLQSQYIQALEAKADAFRQQNQPAPAPAVDPLAQFRDRVDPATLEAMQATMEATRRQLEAETAAKMRALEMQTSVHQLRARIASVPGIAPEVAQSAEQLFMAWRQKGIEFATEQDALNIALGQYHLQQLQRAGSTLTHQPPQIPAVTPSLPVAPAATRAPTRPQNFDLLSRAEQNAILERSADLDLPL